MKLKKDGWFHNIRLKNTIKPELWNIKNQNEIQNDGADLWNEWNMKQAIFSFPSLPSRELHVQSTF
jgi:hypothetical protein